jgi:hypothetical protein
MKRFIGYIGWILSVVPEKTTFWHPSRSDPSRRISIRDTDEAKGFRVITVATSALH